MQRMIAVAMFLAWPAAASAEVVSSSGNGFHVRQEVRLVVPPRAVFDAFGRIGGWWDKAHTYSGNPANLSLSLTPGGCLCERLPGGGGIEHLRVVYVDPGQRLILTGALGPLLYEAVSGVMDVKVEGIAGGSRLVLDYRASGFAAGGADRLAPAVDAMLAGQLKRFRAFAAAQPKTR